MAAMMGVILEILLLAHCKIWKCFSCWAPESQQEFDLQLTCRNHVDHSACACRASPVCRDSGAHDTTLLYVDWLVVLDIYFLFQSISGMMLKFDEISIFFSNGKLKTTSVLQLEATFFSPHVFHITRGPIDTFPWFQILDPGSGYLEPPTQWLSEKTGLKTSKL